MYELGVEATYIKATLMAGYTGSDNYLSVQGHRLAHSDKVQAAMREEAERRSVGILSVAQRRLENILADPSHKDHFGAIKHSQALAGVSPKHVSVIEHKTDRASLVSEIKGSLELLKALGVQVTELVPRSLDTIETTFEEVEE